MACNCQPGQLCTCAVDAGKVRHAPANSANWTTTLGDAGTRLDELADRAPLFTAANQLWGTDSANADGAITIAGNAIVARAGTDSIASMAAASATILARIGTLGFYAMADISTIMDVVERIKSADQSKSLDTTLANDATGGGGESLVVPLTDYGVYFVEGWISYTSGTAPDFKAAWTVPAGASLKLNVFGLVGDGTAALRVGQVYGTSGAALAIATGGNEEQLNFRGWVSLDVTAGDLAFQWAQNTSSATATTVKANSFMRAMRVWTT